MTHTTSKATGWGGRLSQVASGVSGYMRNRTVVEETGDAGPGSEESAVETAATTAQTPHMGDVKTSRTALSPSGTGSDPFTRPDKSELPETPSLPDTAGVVSIRTSPSKPRFHGGGALTEISASQQVEQELKQLVAAVQEATEEESKFEEMYLDIISLLEEAKDPYVWEGKPMQRLKTRHWDKIYQTLKPYLVSAEKTNSAADWGVTAETEPTVADKQWKHAQSIRNYLGWKRKEAESTLNLAKLRLPAFQQQLTEVLKTIPDTYTYQVNPNAPGILHLFEKTQTYPLWHNKDGLLWTRTPTLNVTTSGDGILVAPFVAWYSINDNLKCEGRSKEDQNGEVERRTLLDDAERPNNPWLGPEWSNIQTLRSDRRYFRPPPTNASGWMHLLGDAHVRSLSYSDYGTLVENVENVEWKTGTELAQMAQSNGRGSTG